jgi:hypothetical protein
MLQNIPKLPGSGIVYCLTQRDCDYIAAFLQENGINAKAYHSGMELSEENRADKDTNWDNLERRFKRSPSLVTSSTVPVQLSITLKKASVFLMCLIFIRVSFHV